jgi:Serine protease inhibitor
VLPPAGEFEDYEQRLDAQQLAGLIDELEPRSGTVRLPRFEFTTSVQLSDPLETLGLTDAFDPDQADFTGIANAETSRKLYIDEAYHDAAVVVDEDGTEAAAATGVVVKLEPQGPVWTRLSLLRTDRSCS